MSILSTKLSRLKPSVTLLLNQKAKSLIKEGIDIIPFGVGEPDFDTPDNVKIAGIGAIVDGQTKYTNADGSIEMKKAIQLKFKRENNLDYNLNEIIVSTGAKQVIYNLFVATLDAGDEVIVPAPYWVSYPDMVLLGGGEPVFVNCDKNLKLTPQLLEDKITSKTKWVILNSPGNPSGVCYSDQELRALADVVAKYPHIHVMSDEIYEHIVFDGLKVKSIAQVAPELKQRIFIVNGVSKSYAMTGWRIGYGAGDEKIIKAMVMIQSQSTSSPCSISQAASIEALEGPQDVLKKNAAVFQARRDEAMRLLNASPLLEVTKAQGSFYLFVDMQKAIGKKTPSGKEIKNSDDFSLFLIEEANVAVVPGSAFGYEGFFRLSFATSMEELREGCNRIVTSCNKLS
ncbi:aspartate aminotransferase [Candidatus Phycorickettsia trachydisci]|uniref:Aminotransferase n=1 Tax=Candidatus Phycorickettsia trachydisci TaxID=2115978 RepID=A0A2P1PA67_9RICK|nr:pyridoxal phosphate-dependent aminotransferase [Candidatus Phycorickettsia trachydisci]AVP88149.1 aspartate aminotransferase [Candidatus Phycorickettsia trachydisci]